MLGKSHLFYGVCAGAAATLVLMHPLRPLSLVEAVTAGAIGGLLPDLDEPGSTISNAPHLLGRIAQRLLRRATGSSPLRLVGVLVALVIRAAAALLNVLSRALSHAVRLVSGGHREGTHWAVVWLILSAVVYVLAAPLTALDGKPVLALAFCAGYLSHLLSDGCTRSGLPLVPYTGLRLHLLPRLLRIRTGSAGETAFTTAYAVLIAVALYALLPHHARSLFAPR